MRLRDLGLANAFLYLCGQVLKRLTGARAFVQHYYLVTQPLTGTPRLPQRLGASITVREIAAGDAALAAFPRRQDVLTSRYGQGSVCLAAFRGDELAAFLWLCPHAYREDEVRCTFVPEPPGRAWWDYDVFVVPGQRNGMAFTKLWSSAIELMRSRGVAWSASRISAFVPGSLAAHRRLGAVVTGHAFFVVAYRLQLMLATVRPFVHLSVRDGSAPVLRVGTTGRENHV
jgi:hypothetical protein